MPAINKAKLIFLPLLTIGLAACARADMGGHVRNDPGGGASGAVSSDLETHASGAMNGADAANGDPITGTGNLGSGSTESDPMNGVNQVGPAARF